MKSWPQHGNYSFGVFLAERVKLVKDIVKAQLFVLCGIIWLTIKKNLGELYRLTSLC